MKCIGCISPPGWRSFRVPSAGYKVPHHGLDKHTFVHIYRRQAGVLRRRPSFKTAAPRVRVPPPNHHATFRAVVSSYCELLFYTSATRRRPLVDRQPVEELLLSDRSAEYTFSQCCSDFARVAYPIDRSPFAYSGIVEFIQHQY